MHPATFNGAPSCPPALCSAATVRATTPAKVLCCTRADFDHHLGSLAEIRNMWRFEALRKVGGLLASSPMQRARHIVP